MYSTLNSTSNQLILFNRWREKYTPFGKVGYNVVKRRGWSVFTARLWECLRPPVSPSVTFRYRGHIGWNSSKIISRPSSLRLKRGLAPTWAIWCNGDWNTVRISARSTMDHTEFKGNDVGRWMVVFGVLWCSLSQRCLWMQSDVCDLRDSWVLLELRLPRISSWNMEHSRCYARTSDYKPHHDHSSLT